MKKRIFLTAIWAYVAWYGAVMVAAYSGVTEAIGPIVGMVVAAFVWFAPLSARPSAESATSRAAYHSSPDGASTP